MLSTLLNLRTIQYNFLAQPVQACEPGLGDIKGNLSDSIVLNTSIKH